MARDFDVGPDGRWALVAGYNGFYQCCVCAQKTAQYACMVCKGFHCRDCTYFYLKAPGYYRSCVSCLGETAHGP